MKSGYAKLARRARATLVSALSKGQTRFVRKSLAEGWDRAELIDGDNPLSYCNSTPVAKLLLAGGADVNGGQHNRTPLLLASGSGRVDMVVLLLESGADVNRAYAQRGDPQIPLGTTPLMKAAGRGHLLIVTRLLRAGADLDALDEHGHNALFHALYWDRTKVAKDLLRRGSRLTADALGGSVHHGNLALVEALISSGARLDHVLRKFEPGGHFMEGETLLGCAVRKLCWARATRCFDYPVRIVKLLLEAGSDVNQPTADGPHRRDPISIAANWGQRDVVELLAKAGARKNLRQAFEGGWTLHGASFAGRTQVVKLLLEAGMDAGQKDGRGKTPAEYAAERGHHGIVRLLRRAGGVSESS